MTKRGTMGLLCLANLLLASCGGSTGSTANSGAGAESSDANAGATVWDAANACALLDKATLGAALNDQVTETSIALVHQGAGAEATTSECTYVLASGGRATLMARNSPIADNTPAAIVTARESAAQSVSAFTDRKIEDVADLGKAAFFVPKINQLNVFLDDSKFVVLTLGSASDISAKSLAVDLARRIKR